MSHGILTALISRSYTLYPATEPHAFAACLHASSMPPASHLHEKLQQHVGCLTLAARCPRCGAAARSLYTILKASWGHCAAAA